jgi:nucleoid-associated protein YgaU
MKNVNLPYTHTVQAGDTLPDLCNQVYNNSSYYIQVAKYNGLNKFRNLKPGTQLIFPPIIPE